MVQIVPVTIIRTLVETVALKMFSAVVVAGIVPFIYAYLTVLCRWGFTPVYGLICAIRSASSAASQVQE